MGDYSSGDEASLPADTTNLDHVYDATDLSNVQTNDTNYVDQTGSSGYEIHQYKDSITAGNASVTWIGKSSLAPSSSKVQLQVYKVAVPAGWQDVSGAGASNNVAAADTDFTLSGTIATADYLDTGVTTFRVYQAASLPAGNIFTGETACMGVYNCDNGALTTDSSPVAGGGGLNTLTNVYSTGPVTNDTTNKQQGDASAYFVRSDLCALQILQGAMTSGFPWRSDDTDMQGTVCFWWRSVVNASGVGLVGNVNQAFSGSWELALDAVPTNLAITWVYSGGTETLDTGFAPSELTWYHIGVRIDGVNKVANIRVWNGASATTYTMSPSNTMVVATLGFCLGNWTNGYAGNPTGINGNLDEVVVFSRLLSDDEIDAIRGGTFGH